MAFGDVKVDNDVKKEKDSLGGFQLIESGIVDFRIKTAFVVESSKGSKGLSLYFEGKDDNSQYRETFYVTTGTEKGCVPYWENKKTGEKHSLKGYNLANAVCLLAAGVELSELETENKMIDLYSKEDQKEVPTEVEMCIELLDTEISIGILKVRENKNEQDPKTGDWLPTNEERLTNQIDKFFDSESHMTVQETLDAAENGLTYKEEDLFYTKWSKKWTGKTKDTFKEVKGGATKGSPLTQKSEKKVSAFAKKKNAKA